MGMRWQVKSPSLTDRIHSMESTLKDLKSSSVPLVGGTLSGVIGLAPTFLRRVFLFNFFLRGGSAVVSCFPATPDTLILDGCKIIDLISCVGALGQPS